MLREESDILRIIDADLNRSLEALRVLEEAARFMLDSSDLSAFAKSLRHKLSTTLGPLSKKAIRCRRIESDVGKDMSADAELSRENALEVF